MIIRSIQLAGLIVSLTACAGKPGESNQSDDSRQSSDVSVGQTDLDYPALPDDMVVEAEAAGKTIDPYKGPKATDGEASEKPLQEMTLDELAAVDEVDGNLIVDAARPYLGKPYQFGASSQSISSFDSASLVQRAVKESGLGIFPRTAQDQEASASRNQFMSKVPFDRATLKSGDILFWKHMGSHVPAGTVSHAGIYLGAGKFITAYPDRGVRIFQLKDYFLEAPRPFAAYRFIKMPKN